MAKAKKKRTMRKSIPQAVLEQLTKARGRALTTDELAQKTKRDRASVSSACSRLKRQKKIASETKVVSGVEAKYKIAPKRAR